ncbi:hypothetical protein BDV93DRAFT_559210 [Ceratobasidium sp. AG-I]|nr:hypothetical protein BDV93DRAFT_559210 [Ceratobasidium sp. AG-I]
MSQTKYQYITTDNLFAYCAICRDVSNQLARFDSRGIRRHIETEHHTNNARRAEQLLMKGATEAPPATQSEAVESENTLGPNEPLFEFSLPENSTHTPGFSMQPTDCSHETDGESDCPSDDDDLCSQPPDAQDDLFAALIMGANKATSATPPASDSSGSGSDYDDDDERVTDDEFIPVAYSRDSRPNEWSPWPSKNVTLFGKRNVQLSTA